LFQAGSLARIFSLDYDRAELERKAGWGGKFLGLESRTLGLTVAGELPVMHCINLDRSPQRMSRCTEFYREDYGLPLFGNRAAFATARKLMQRRKLDLLYFNEMCNAAGILHSSVLSLLET